MKNLFLIFLFWITSNYTMANISKKDFENKLKIGSIFSIRLNHGWIAILNPEWKLDSTYSVSSMQVEYGINSNNDFKKLLFENVDSIVIKDRNYLDHCLDGIGYSVYFTFTYDVYSEDRLNFACERFRVGAYVNHINNIYAFIYFNENFDNQMKSIMKMFRTKKRETKQNESTHF